MPVVWQEKLNPIAVGRSKKTVAPLLVGNNFPHDRETFSVVESSCQTLVVQTELEARIRR